MQTVSFIGRFQPFHLGHLSVLKKINRRNDVSKIIIGVGSSQYSLTDKNPFSFEQRKQMIDDSIKGVLKKEYIILAIPDVHDNNIWADHVLQITGKIDEVYTGNSLVKQLLSAKQIKIKYIFKYVLKHRFNSATRIRKLIKNNNLRWQKMVPQPVAEFISKL